MSTHWSTYNSRCNSKYLWEEYIHGTVLLPWCEAAVQTENSSTLTCKFRQKDPERGSASATCDALKMSHLTTTAEQRSHKSISSNHVSTSDYRRAYVESGWFFPSKFPLKESKVGVRSDYYYCYHGSAGKELGWEDFNRLFLFLQAVVKVERRKKKTSIWK